MPGRWRLQILVVNDGRGLADAVGPSVRAMGHDVRVADAAASWPADRDAPPDVVVLNLDAWPANRVGPGRQTADGWRWRKPFVVALTDDPLLVGSRRAMETGADLVLVRPIEFDLVAGVLRRFGDLLDGAASPGCCEAATAEPPGPVTGRPKPAGQPESDIPPRTSR